MRGQWAVASGREPDGPGAGYHGGGPGAGYYQVNGPRAGYYQVGGPGAGGTASAAAAGPPKPILRGGLGERSGWDRARARADLEQLMVDSFRFVPGPGQKCGQGGQGGKKWVVNLAGCGLVRLPSGLCRLWAAGVSRLQLARNGLAALPRALRHLRSLRFLEVIPSSPLCYLQVLSCSHL